MPFLFLKEDSRKAMHNSRLDAIKAIARLAKNPAAGIDFVLVCGDVIDNLRISDSVLTSMFKEIKGIEKPVYLLAGNHEWNGTEYIFENEHFKAMLPPNVTILSKGEFETSVQGIVIVAAPLAGKHADEDVLEQVVSELEPSNAFRILAGHGSLDTFIDVNKEEKKLSFGAISKALSSKTVNYVALGDRHSTTSIDSKGAHLDFQDVKNGEVLPVYYSGSHEATDYDELDAGNILVVEVSPQHEVSVERVRVGSWKLTQASTLQNPWALRTRDDIKDLEAFIDQIEDPRQTAVKIYLDSELYLDDDLYRDRLFTYWHEEYLGGFVYSKHSEANMPRIKKDPLEYEIPSNIKSYVKETYRELREAATGDSPDALIKYQAFSLLTSFLGANR